MVIEPIQGEGGFIVPAPGFLPRLANWCRRNGVVFVADEVQTGIARTGAMFACNHEGVVPDLIVIAKGGPASRTRSRSWKSNVRLPGPGTPAAAPLPCAVSRRS